VPQFADIPEPGAAIDPGSPVFSFFATGPTPAAVRDRLRARAAELDHLFRDTHP
jgi:predicted ATP-grasp superfamily ATP-dependent carboligase